MNCRLLFKAGFQEFLVLVWTFTGKCFIFGTDDEFFFGRSNKKKTEKKEN